MIQRANRLASNRTLIVPNYEDELGLVEILKDKNFELPYGGMSANIFTVNDLDEKSIEDSIPYSSLIVIKGKNPSDMKPLLKFEELEVAIYSEKAVQSNEDTEHQSRWTIPLESKTGVWDSPGLIIQYLKPNSKTLPRYNRDAHYQILSLAGESYLEQTTLTGKHFSDNPIRKDYFNFVFPNRVGIVSTKGSSAVNLIYASNINSNDAYFLPQKTEANN